MRSGVAPLLIWSLLLGLMAMVNVIWAGITIQTATFALAVLAVVIVAAGLLTTGPRRGPEAIPRYSLATAFTAVGLAVLLFGLTFGHFLVYLGAAVIVAGIGRLTLELRAQRRAGR
jgi:hypothetical protein